MQGPQQSQKPRLVSPHDLAVVVRYLVFGTVAWLVPERLWLTVSRVMARLEHAASLPQDRSLMQQIPALVGDGDRLDPHDAAFDRTVTRNLYFLQMLKVHHPWGLRQPIALHGEDRVAAGLKKGLGVILWAGLFHCASLIEPIALTRAGFAFHQLSRWDHGPSLTRFGLRWLNSIVLSGENRFLAERIVIEEGSFAALVKLQERIKQNSVVGIRAIDHGRRLIELPFLRGRIRIAPGPVELALATGAVVLPMFTVRNAAGVQEVHIEAPIDIDRSGDRNEAVAMAMTEYVRRLEPYVLKYPGQWGGWAHQVRAGPVGEDHGVRAVLGDP